MIGTLVLNYKIEKQIGEGGMGTVYLGKHTTLDRNVAIKVLLPEFARNTEIKERFINEARTLSKLSHQNIVTLYDFAELDGNLFLIMEYVEGLPLDDYLKQSNTKDEYIATNIFIQILNGFDYAHNKGIVHRDIKPANIILSNEAVPKILDFGIAKIVQGDIRLTKTGMKMGSVLYMSPEQILGKDVDFRSDIYSLGITLYELLVGRNPYDYKSKSEYEIQSEIVNNYLPPINTFNPLLSDNIQQIINVATAKDPNNRFQSCNQFKEAFIGNNALNDSLKLPNNYQNSNSKTQILNLDHNKTIIQNSSNNYTNQQLNRNSKSTPIIIISILVILIVIGFIIYKTNFSEPDLKVTTSSEVKKEPKIEQLSQEQTKLDIRSTIERFLNCWQNKDISCMQSLMTEDYQYETATGKNKYQDKTERLSVWRQQFQERKYINITHSDIDVRIINENQVTASYNQTYNSDKYNDTGYKVIYLRKESGSWKIYKDSFY
ncbi:MAG: protein kinase [Ignavibacteriae bacterium]|nr:protein kinase [Ignavibacteriota bacterium]